MRLSSILRNGWKPFLVIIALIVIDQITKRAVLAHVDFRERINVIPGFFDITLLFNKGAAFSFLANQGGWQHYFFVGCAVIISLFLLWHIVKGELRPLSLVASVLVVGGAMGNVVDRFDHGQVVDFLLFYLGEHYYPAFNAADCFVCLGAFFFILDSILQGKEEKRERQKPNGLKS